MKQILKLCGLLLSDCNISYDEKIMVRKFALKVIAKIEADESMSGIHWWSGE